METLESDNLEQLEVNSNEEDLTPRAPENEEVKLSSFQTEPRISGSEIIS